jgi:hypothetical protein
MTYILTFPSAPIVSSLRVLLLWLSRTAPAVHLTHGIVICLGRRQWRAWTSRHYGNTYVARPMRVNQY